MQALGYGAPDYGMDNTYYLKYVDVPAISNSQCTAYYGNTLPITAQDLCHNSSSTADTCQVNNCHFDASRMSKIIYFFLFKTRVILVVQLHSEILLTDLLTT